MNRQFVEEKGPQSPCVVNLAPLLIRDNNNKSTPHLQSACQHGNIYGWLYVTMCFHADGLRLTSSCRQLLTKQGEKMILNKATYETLIYYTVTEKGSFQMVTERERGDKDNCRNNTLYGLYVL